MKDQLYIDKLFWFFQYKRECGKYIALHKRYIAEFCTTNVEYFTSMRPQSDKVYELSEKVLAEIKATIENLSTRQIGEYLFIIQKFLNEIYEGMDLEYSERETNGMDLAFPRGIPSIQNYIRSVYVTETITPPVIAEDGIGIKHCLLFLYGDKKILNKSAYTKKLANSGWTQDYAEKIYVLLEEYLNDKFRISRPSKTWNKKAEDLKDPVFYAKVKAKLYPS